MLSGRLWGCLVLEDRGPGFELRMLWFDWNRVCTVLARLNSSYLRFCIKFSNLIQFFFVKAWHTCLMLSSRHTCGSRDPAYWMTLSGNPYLDYSIVHRINISYTSICNSALMPHLALLNSWIERSCRAVCDMFVLLLLRKDYVVIINQCCVFICQSGRSNDTLKSS